MTQICVCVCVCVCVRACACRGGRYLCALPVLVLLRGTTRGFSAPHSPSSALPPALCEVSLTDSPGWTDLWRTVMKTIQKQEFYTMPDQHQRLQWLPTDHNYEELLTVADSPTTRVTIIIKFTTVPDSLKQTGMRSKLKGTAISNIILPEWPL